MNRRHFLSGTACLALATAGGQAAARRTLWNPCRSVLPPSLAEHDLIRSAWEGLDATRVWDCHAHLAGLGDSGIGADQQHQGTRATAKRCAPQALERRYGIARPVGIDFGAVEFETRITGDRQANHCQTLCRADSRLLARCRLTGRNPAHARQIEQIGGFLGEAQMAMVHRVEGSTEDSERAAG